MPRLVPLRHRVVRLAADDVQHIQRVRTPEPILTGPTGKRVGTGGVRGHDEPG